MSDELDKMILLLHGDRPASVQCVPSRWADKIHSVMHTERSISQLIASDRKPTRDIDDLRKSAKQIRRAMNHLSDVGYFGGKELVEYVQ